MMTHYFLLNRIPTPTQTLKAIYIFWLCLLLTSLPVFAEPIVVGHISFIKGSNAAQLADEIPRVLGLNAKIYQGDNIQTTERSFLIITFNDGSKVTIRPNSNFTIDHFNKQSAQLYLHQGGVNTTTGDITKANPDNFQIKTPTSTIKAKAKEAEFAIRICDKACEERGKKAAATGQRSDKSIVARVVEIKGEVNAINRSFKNANERLLSIGKALYNSDTVYSERDSYVILLFPDGEKVSLDAESELDIKEYSYQIKNKKDHIFLRLVSGGIRALSGKIGKKNPSAFSMKTPVATIGIRGTGTDSYYDGTTLDHSTWKGLSFVKNAMGEFDVPAGSSSLTSNLNQTPRIFKTPETGTDRQAPRPDKNKSEPKKVFKPTTPAQGDTSVKTISGTTVMQSNDNTSTEVETGEIGSTGRDGTTTIPPEQNNDNSSNTPPAFFDNSPPGGDGGDGSFDNNNDGSIDGC